MDSMESILCNGTIIINTTDFMLISMGSGIGYFIICYLCIKTTYDYYKLRVLENQEVITATHV